MPDYISIEDTCRARARCEITIRRLRCPTHQPDGDDTRYRQFLELAQILFVWLRDGAAGRVRLQGLPAVLELVQLSGRPEQVPRFRWI